MEFFLLLLIALVVVFSRKMQGQNVSKFVQTQFGSLYDKLAPY